MIALLCRRNFKYFYSNIKLQVEKEEHAAYLTLTNSKKRNPMALATIL